MNSQYYIQSYSAINENTVSLNGRILYEENKATGFSEFIKIAYKTLEMKYPKFFKMDNLSKLAFLAADVLLKQEQQLSSISADNDEAEIDELQESNIAIVLSNRASSLDTDRKHQEAIASPDEYYPSPAVFVYTLPNICIGEISIKHKLFSENSFFIFDHFNAKHLHAYAENLLKTKKADKVLCGWVDFDEENYKAFLYLVSENGPTIHNTEEITRLYNTL